MTCRNSSQLTSRQRSLLSSLVASDDCLCQVRNNGRWSWRPRHEPHSRGFHDLTIDLLVRDGLLEFGSGGYRLTANGKAAVM